MCASKPSVPKVKTPPKPVQTKDVTDSVATARADQQSRAQSAVGRSGTIMTGGLGLGDEATTQKKKLG
jgi:hypothetical protein